MLYRHFNTKKQSKEKKIKVSLKQSKISDKYILSQQTKKTSKKSLIIKEKETSNIQIRDGA